MRTRRLFPHDPLRVPPQGSVERVLAASFWQPSPNRERDAEVISIVRNVVER